MSDAATEPVGTSDDFPDFEDFRAVGKRLSNWGRWGDDDERGALNLITPERLIAAAGLVKQGKVFNLGIPMDETGPQLGKERNNPLRLMSETGEDQPYPEPFHYVDDYIIMPLQGSSQWDALGHVYYDDHLYNGFPVSDVTPHGLKHASIDKIAKDVIGRGVLLDIARYKGVDWLEQGYVITPEDLDGAAAKQGVEVKAGDIVLFRTGWRKLYVDTGSREDFMAGEPGLGMAAVKWTHDHDVAALASDNWAIEVLPGEYEGQVFNVHMVLLRDMGVTLGEILDFEELAEDCVADGVYEFLFTAPALPFTRGAGSPINPLAVK
jgi:kynurenine formamidase